MNNATINASENCLVVSGALNFQTVSALWAASIDLFKKSTELVIDLSSVNSSSTNSAGLALLIEWIKLAKELNKPLRFENIPSQLMAIASSSGVHHLLQKS